MQYVAVIVIELLCWTAAGSVYGEHSFSRALDAPIAARWRRQHRLLWVLLLALALAVLWWSW
ncbi:MAG: hypothetical protein HYV26_05975 [Candidatus Hydrogenedentes bacterium]|nr:hypothetical protein [Candidatus Hydrogenedentota bacterium]